MSAAPLRRPVEPVSAWRQAPTAKAPSTLKVIPEPRTSTSTAWWVMSYVAILVTAFVSVLFLNSLMAKTAFDLQKAEQELQWEWDRGTSLIAQVEEADSPAALIAAAEKLGLQPAEQVIPLSVAGAIDSQTENAGK